MINKGHRSEVILQHRYFWDWFILNSDESLISAYASAKLQTKETDIKSINPFWITESFVRKKRKQRFIEISQLSMEHMLYGIKPMAKSTWVYFQRFYQIKFTSNSPIKINLVVLIYSMTSKGTTYIWYQYS